MVNKLSYGPRGLALTKSFERLILSAYADEGGIWTIGWGHTGKDVRRGMTITPIVAEQLLHSDLAASIACVNLAVTRPVNQHQFDALVDFTFNAGRASFLHSSLLRNVNLGKLELVPTCFRMWVDCCGFVSDGLVRRREAEIALFRDPVPAPVPGPEVRA